MIKNLFVCSFFFGSQCKGIIFIARSLYTKFGRSYHFFRKLHWISTTLLFLYPFLSVLTESKLGEPCLHLLSRVGSTDGAPYEPEFLQVGDTRDTQVGLHGSHQSTYSAHLVSAEGNERPALQLLVGCLNVVNGSSFAIQSYTSKPRAYGIAVVARCATNTEPFEVVGI